MTILKPVAGRSADRGTSRLTHGSVPMRVAHRGATRSLVVEDRYLHGGRGPMSSMDKIPTPRRPGPTVFAGLYMA